LDRSGLSSAHEPTAAASSFLCRTFGLFEGAFGFANVTAACFNGVTVCANPDQYLFWDTIHPTAHGHSLLAAAAATAVPEPATLLLLASGVRLADGGRLETPAPCLGQRRTPMRSNQNSASYAADDSHGRGSDHGLAEVSSKLRVIALLLAGSKAADSRGPQRIPPAPPTCSWLSALEQLHGPLQVSEQHRIVFVDV
jgi:hypothetical protein